VRRAPLAFLLAFLLLAFQQQVAVHALEHRPVQVETGFTAPAEPSAPCATCELLASGADSVAASAFVSPAFAGPHGFATVAFRSRAVAAPAAYASRAPPELR
jgi:hypothetical protein